MALRTRKILLELMESVLKPMAINRIAEKGSPAISPQMLTGFSYLWHSFTRRCKARNTDG